MCYNVFSIFFWGDIVYNLIKKFLFFCLIISCCGFIFLIFKTPLKLSSSENFDYNYKIREINLPIVQHFKIKVSNFSGILINLGDNTYNDLDCIIELFDEDGILIASKELENYNSNLVDFRFNLIKNSVGKNYILKIKSSNTDKFKLLLSDDFDKNNYIEKFNGNMKISALHYEKNYGYFWYIFMFIAIIVTLLESLKGDDQL